MVGDDIIDKRQGLAIKVRGVSTNRQSESGGRERQVRGQKGLTSPADGLGSRLPGVAMLGTGLCQGQSRLWI